MTVPVRHDSGPAHRRLIANALNAISVFFNGLPTAASGDVMVSDGDGTVTWGRPSGSVVQTVNASTGEYATTTTTIPADDTIPQNTEGVEVLTASITPKNVNNKLRIDVRLQADHSLATARIIAALFQDSTASALAAGSHRSSAQTNDEVGISFTHWLDAGTTSSTTFKLRAGSSNTGTLYVNGKGAGRYLGGVAVTSITITEYAA